MTVSGEGTGSGILINLLLYRYHYRWKCRDRFYMIISTQAYFIFPSRLEYWYQVRVCSFCPAAKYVQLMISRYYMNGFLIANTWHAYNSSCLSAKFWCNWTDTGGMVWGEGSNQHFTKKKRIVLQKWSPTNSKLFAPVTLVVRKSYAPRTDQTDHDLDHLDPNLPVWRAVQDLYRTDPIQETRARPCRLFGSHAATWST